MLLDACLVNFLAQFCHTPGSRRSGGLESCHDDDVLSARVSLLVRTSHQDQPVGHGAVGCPRRQCGRRFRGQPSSLDPVGEPRPGSGCDYSIADARVLEPGERALVVMAGVPVDVARAVAVGRRECGLPHPGRGDPLRGGLMWRVDRLVAGHADRCDGDIDRPAGRADGQRERRPADRPWCGLTVSAKREAARGCDRRAGRRRA
jgi:hypothetical protein